MRTTGRNHKGGVTDVDDLSIAFGHYLTIIAAVIAILRFIPEGNIFPEGNKLNADVLSFVRDDPRKQEVFESPVARRGEQTTRI